MSLWKINKEQRYQNLKHKPFLNISKNHKPDWLKLQNFAQVLELVLLVKIIDIWFDPGEQWCVNIFTIHQWLSIIKLFLIKSRYKLKWICQVMLFMYIIQHKCINKIDDTKVKWHYSLTIAENGNEQNSETWLSDSNLSGSESRGLPGFPHSLKVYWLLWG